VIQRIAERSALAAGLFALCVATPASANFHLWQIEEIFSNADGTIQYVEFFSSSTFDQNLLLHHVLQSLQDTTAVDSFEFPSNLGTPTRNHFFLLATPAFEAAAGIKPDYTLAPDQVFIHLGATNKIALAGASTTPFTFDPSALPTDGTHALAAVGGTMFPPDVAVASPINFAGEMGQLVPEPEPAVLGLAALGALALIARRRAP
jgi:serralysin